MVATLQFGTSQTDGSRMRSWVMLYPTISCFPWFIMEGKDRSSNFPLLDSSIE